MQLFLYILLVFWTFAVVSFVMTAHNLEPGGKLLDTLQVDNIFKGLP